jgi:hypothetical protein
LKKKKKTETPSPDTSALVPDLSNGKKLSEVLDADVVGLENLADHMTPEQLKVLNVILTDFSEEPEAEMEKSVFKRLRGACKRAGMLEDPHTQREFFQILADPKFMKIVKATGKGLVGMFIVPLLEAQIKLAVEGNQTALDRLFEMVELKQSKYDFYLQRVAMNKTDINVGGDLNFEGKTDAELKELAASFRDVGDAEATVS